MEKPNFATNNKIWFFTHQTYLDQMIFFFNWDSLHARLSNHYDACNLKKKKHLKIKAYKKSVQKETTIKRC